MEEESGAAEAGDAAPILRGIGAAADEAGFRPLMAQQSNISVSEGQLAFRLHLNVHVAANRPVSCVEEIWVLLQGAMQPCHGTAAAPTLMETIFRGDDP
jgi:hypothetical protein